MAQSITIPGLTGNFLLPGYYQYVVFGSAPNTGQGGTIKMVIIADASGGDTTHYPVNTVYGPDTQPPIADTATVLQAFGINSEMTQSVSVGKNVAPEVPIYMIPVADTGTKGTSTLAATGTATKANVLNVKVNKTLIQVPIKSGDLPATYLALAAALIGAARAEFTAAYSTLVTVTAGSPGVRNQPTVKAWLAYVDSAITLTVVNSVVSGTSVVDLTAALALCDKNNNFYLKVAIPGADEAATTNTYELLSSNVTTQAQPLNDNPSIGFGGMRGNFAALTTYAIGAATKLQGTINNPRTCFPWHSNGISTTAEIVMRVAASCAHVWSQLVVKFNMCKYGLNPLTSGPNWNAGGALGVPATTEPSVNIESALECGVTPISQQNGQTYLVRPVTTHSYDPVSSTQDQRIVDLHKTFVLDYVQAQIRRQTDVYTTEKTLVDDPTNENEAPPPNSTCPKYIKTGIASLLDRMAADGWIENVENSKQFLVVQRDPSNKQRALVQVPIDAIDILAQMAVETDQVG